MAADLARAAKEQNIRYFLISFVDLFGVLRAKLVPASAIAEMQETGAGFAGFATWLDMTPADPDMFAIPDPESLIQLPWKPEVGWLAADLWMDGKEVETSPRIVLKRQIDKAAKPGYRMKSGVECEYFLLNADGTTISDERDVQEKPCYDQSALMRRYDVISEICDYMGQLGWGPYQNDHEDANGQFEMNWHYDDCLRTADKQTFFKYMVKSIAEKHGLRATFMPKPFSNLTGNGCHAHVSLWDQGGTQNLFLDSTGELGLSELAYQFLGGIIHNADAMAAVFNPSVNSYKRIDATVTLSGATWSPNAISYSGNNRTHMVRVPEPGRFELRLMDGSSNPYLLQAGVLVAGLDGIENDREPGKRLDINMYTEGHTVKRIRKLPLNLLDAVRLFDKSKIVREGFGDEFVTSYVKLKLDEWGKYARTLTPWERENTLDC
ncbi:MAG: type III glutamate--ammonia ligase [Gammaproteobacteria bacterium]|nr:type III glutamate--ammonia ligase [Gammaproteobacteria bacterium]NIR83408.1 type III glutamate--ammonia ligase [Gammaproteobacteria bacterium]NIR91330.1 type III glutamate--ammonia ligase [Gammaproteobacteria bacterium]NIU04570.1 type III glutamate--ammonia ligase [Gammaproteobacteria bacterium]NIV51612.1 type III glutamate--ammonia ligase [Gammaproteobacteria bacterium]